MPFGDPDCILNEALKLLIAVIRQEIDLLASINALARMVQDLTVRMQE
jgi:hypothetical protein